MKKISALLLALALGLTALTGCSQSGSSGGAPSKSEDAPSAGASGTLTGSITGSGSSALLPLAKDAAEKFKVKNPGVSITLNGGGSGTGLKQVADGSVDIGNSDVEAESKLEASQASTLVDHKVCVITMAPVVNKELGETVKSLTKQQLIDLFTGKTANWKEVGGPDEEVILVTRPATSGTRALFREFALDNNEEASNSALETDDSGTLLQSVSSHKGAIGYVALSYLKNNDSVATVAIDGVEPTMENTYNGTYPVWGYEHMYTKGEPAGAVKAFLDYVMSNEYGVYMEEQGYCVTSKMTVSR